jgi:hypothetical protein
VQTYASPIDDLLSTGSLVSFGLRQQTIDVSGIRRLEIVGTISLPRCLVLSSCRSCYVTQHCQMLRIRAETS